MYLSNTCFSQKPIGKFLVDTLVIGKPILYSLTFKHPSNQNVFFPIEDKSFFPFTLGKINPFTTNTINEISTDSVVYELTSFDVSQIQYLALPVYIQGLKDCTMVSSNVDSVFSNLKILNANLVKPLDSTHFLNLPQTTDLPKLLLYIGIILAFLAFIYTLFGRTINRYIKLFSLRSRHQDFIKGYLKLSKSSLDEVKVAKALVLWKSYMQSLEKRPFSTFTTKEINEKIENADLADALREIDTAIYAGILSIKMPESMETLKIIADEFYNNRWNQLSDELKLKNSN